MEEVMEEVKESYKCAVAVVVMLVWKLIMHKGEGRRQAEWHHC